MRKIGIRLDPEMLAATRLLFEGAWDMNLPSGGSRINEVFYGDHARNTMDIFTPGKNNSPVVLFVHGGGFVAGDKAFNSHIGAFFARHGFLTAIMNYRLAPDSVWPCGAIDVASAVDWLAANACLDWPISRFFSYSRSHI
jgi:acetyl esterase/lipase